MLIVQLRFLAAIAAAAGTPPLAAQPAGPFAARCGPGVAAPALLVHITGFKAHTGTVRVQSYGGDPQRYFDKGSYLRRVELPVPAATNALDVCLPVPAPGSYAVSVRHDLNGSGSADRGDGGGMSGNPRLSLLDVLFKRKPDPAAVAVQVGRGVRTVPIVLNYISGARFRPVAG